MKILFIFCSERFYFTFGQEKHIFVLGLATIFFIFVKVPSMTNTQPTRNLKRNLAVFSTLSEMLKVTVNFLSHDCQLYSRTSPLCPCICLLFQTASVLTTIYWDMSQNTALASFNSGNTILLMNFSRHTSPVHSLHSVFIRVLSFEIQIRIFFHVRDSQWRGTISMLYVRGSASSGVALIARELTLAAIQNTIATEMLSPRLRHVSPVICEDCPKTDTTTLHNYRCLYLIFVQGFPSCVVHVL